MDKILASGYTSMILAADLTSQGLHCHKRLDFMAVASENRESTGLNNTERTASCVAGYWWPGHDVGLVKQIISMLRDYLHVLLATDLYKWIFISVAWIMI